MKEPEVLKIDVEGVLRERLPRLCRFIPSGIFRKLERTICQNQLNELLRENAGKEGAEFCRGVFDTLSVSCRVVNEQFLPSPEHRRITFVSNHPLGALDGMMLIDFVHRHYGGQVWFVVNDLLLHVKPLQSVFLPVNKHGIQSRISLERLDEAFAGNDPIIVFPAGLVSRLQPAPAPRKGKVVADLEWQKMFVNRSVRFRRDVVPLYFHGLNSMKFYRMALRRKRLGLKFNIEQIFLPREIFNSRGKVFTIAVGKTIPWRRLEGKPAQCSADEIRQMVYGLATACGESPEIS